MLRTCLKKYFSPLFGSLLKLNDTGRFCAWAGGIARLKGREWRRTRYTGFGMKWAGDEAEDVVEPERDEHDERWSDLCGALSRFVGETSGSHSLVLFSKSNRRSWLDIY